MSKAIEVGSRYVNCPEELVKLQFEIECTSVEELRKYIKNIAYDKLIPNPRVGSIFYCGTGGNTKEINTVKDIFLNTNK